jgi:hypothetical protein
MLKNILSKLPSVRKVVAERDALKKKLEDQKKKTSDEREKGRAKQAAQKQKFAAEREMWKSRLKELERDCGFVPPGHFYSPIPSLEEVSKDDEAIFGAMPRGIPGVDLREEEQLQLLHTLLPYYREMPFQDKEQEGLRYYFDNPSYTYSDAIFLHCLIRHLRPKRFIEVGSGFSSCVTLDTNDRFFAGGIDVSFIEPYPDLLKSLVSDSERSKIKIIQSRLQDVNLGLFDSLQSNDILFIDSTHVSKVHSDVNRVIFDILPRLAPGVHVHVHDVFYPFEYPKAWIMEGRAWNEAYLLRAFLQYNSAWRVVLMNTYMEIFHAAFFKEHMPLCLKNPGASIWLRRE